MYLLALWHGYVLLVRPLIFHAFPIPLSNEVQIYSKALLVNQAWAYFYKPPDKNIEVYYSANGSLEKKLFFGSSPDFLQQRRFYRCAGCADASYQFYNSVASSEDHWLIGYYICAFQFSSDQLKIEVKAAPYNSPNFQTVKTQDISCGSYQ